LRILEAVAVRFILGVDPGVDGGFVLINEAGQIIDTERMTYDGSTLSATATANVYKTILQFVQKYESEHNDPSTLTVFIEKAFTKPTDAMSMEHFASLKGLRSVAVELTRTYDNHKNGIRVPKESFDAQFGDLGSKAASTAWLDGYRYKPDGRVGNFNYAKSCGVLEICAAYGIAYVLVHPSTWTAFMHKGADAKLPPKDRSKQIVGRLWPEYAQKGSPLWPSRCKSFHLGLLDAFMLAQWGLKNF
jgi:hypothetical protein